MSANEKKHTKSEQSDGTQNQMSYVCEGFIKEVKIQQNGVTFTLEPAAPYLFEKKEEDGRTKKLLLFVDNRKNPNSAKIVGDNGETWFSVPSEKCDLSAMLVAKANHLRVRVVSSLELGKESKLYPHPKLVEELTVL